MSLPSDRISFEHKEGFWGCLGRQYNKMTSTERGKIEKMRNETETDGGRDKHKQKLRTRTERVGK